MCIQAAHRVCLLGLSLLLLPRVDRADTLLVANKSDDTVDLINLDTGRSAATLPTGHAPHEIAVSRDGSTAVVTNYGSREIPGNTLTVVDVQLAKVSRTLELGDHTRPHGVVFVAEHRVAVTAEGSAHLLVVDLQTGQIVTAIATDQETSHMVATVPDSSRVFVANIGSGTVSVIDLEKDVKLFDIATGEGAEGIAVTPDGSELWVGNRAADTLTIIDPTSLEILATLPCPGFPIRIAFAPDGSRALVSAAQSGEVVVFDTHQRLEIRRTKLDLSNAPDASRRLFGDRFGDSPVPVGLVNSPSGSTAWVAATQADAVVVIETETLVVRDLLRAGREPDGMAFSPMEVVQFQSSDH